MEEIKSPALPADLQAKLEAARARQAARDAKLEASRPVKTAEREIKQEALETLCEKLTEEHGGPFYVYGDEAPVGAMGFVYELPVLDKLVVVKRGPGVLWNRYSASKMKGEDDEKFLTPCVVQPSRTEVQAIFADQPAALGPLVVELAKLYGYRDKADQKK